MGDTSQQNTNTSKMITEKFITDQFSAFERKMDKKLQKTASKSDVRRAEKAQWQGQLRLEERIENVEDTIKESKQNTNHGYDDMKKRMDKSDEQNREYRDDIMNKLDDLIGKYETAEQERIIGNHQMRELQEKVENQERLLSNIAQH